MHVVMHVVMIMHMVMIVRVMVTLARQSFENRIAGTR